MSGNKKVEEKKEIPQNPMEKSWLLINKPIEPGVRELVGQSTTFSSAFVNPQEEETQGSLPGPISPEPNIPQGPYPNIPEEIGVSVMPNIENEEIPLESSIILNCLHTFPKNFLANLKQNGGDIKITCPKCKEKTSVSDPKTKKYNYLSDEIAMGKAAEKAKECLQRKGPEAEAELEKYLKIADAERYICQNPGCKETYDRVFACKCPDKKYFCNKCYFEKH